MNKRYKKYQLTAAIYDLLPSDKKLHLSIEKLVFKWFVTGRMGDGLRLTPEGMQAFDSTDIEYFEYPFFKEGKNVRNYENFNIHEFTLKVGKLVKCPFYLGATDKVAYIKVYDSKIAMMISLYGGNLLDYIEAMEKKNE